jgi:hypothetical protein
MSERGEIEVLFPVNHVPSRAEHVDLLRRSFVEARRLLDGAGGGQVLGIAKVARAETTDGKLALRVTLAVVAPESVWHHRSSFPVNSA